VLEALACGVPVAAFPAPGPLDILAGSGAGILGDDLGAAAMAAMAISRDRSRQHALRYSWRESIGQFAENLAPM
jgi:1,2-diacylglycerol 3-alpha-glucosyltransferase/glucuronosyltransferase